MSSLAINSYTSRPPRVVGHFCWGFSWSINSTIDELKSRRARLQPSTIQSPVVTDASLWSKKFFFTIDWKLFCFSWKRLKKTFPWFDRSNQTCLKRYKRVAANVTKKISNGPSSCLKNDWNLFFIYESRHCWVAFPWWWWLCKKREP